MDEMVFPCRVRDGVIEDTLINLALCTGVRAHTHQADTSVAYMIGGHQFHIALPLDKFASMVGARA